MAINFENQSVDTDEKLDSGILVTENAAKRIQILLDQESNPNQVFRVSVLGGGCSGFQYKFSFDETLNTDDIVITKLGIKVVIDNISSNYLSGSEIDYSDELMGAMFVVKNPNATASCGCGTSFSVG
ncbi:MAG: iron-sulfur cluster insertion protein ErpA [Rhodospirillaceae bacterium]|nr:iron-sulfur cluster insertion protein ErpA [Rhodospirillaceae bacterium]|tara:strand:- start:1505 stop:1885 length:381 start_codon:yes stop_codon:yes gene_type:complete